MNNSVSQNNKLLYHITMPLVLYVDGDPPVFHSFQFENIRFYFEDDTTSLFIGTAAVEIAFMHIYSLTLLQSCTALSQ